MSDDIKRRALSGLFWALLQNWSAKGLSFVLFLILARLLTPTELGVAAAINVVIALVSLIAEQGFSDAIVQRRDLKDDDINLPFFSSLGMASVLALSVAMLSSQIERWMNVPGLAPLLVVATASLPLTAMSMFQEAIYRRQLLFKQVAVRMLTTATIAGAVAVACAYVGMGSWSLVVQAIVMNALNVLWLWYRPLWRPSRRINTRAYGEIVRFSGNVLVSRVLDVVGTRSIEVLIAALHGAAALGLYAVGARVFQTMMQLLTTAVANVSLGALSRFAHDIQRLQRAFIKTVIASAAVGMPVFVAGSAVSHELALFLFGSKWAAAGDVMGVLLLLGALQCIQFVNGPTFSALGRPRYLAWMATIKAVAAIAAISLVPTDDILELTIVFALSQAITTPLTYALLARCLQLSIMSIVRELLPFTVAAAAAYSSVYFSRELIESEPTPLVIALTLLLLLYGAVYCLLAMLLGRRQIELVWAIFRK